jgi:hypothetical protein
MFFRKTKSNVVPMNISFFSVNKGEMHRMKEALQLRKISANDVINIETEENCIKVWYKTDYTDLMKCSCINSK